MQLSRRELITRRELPYHHIIGFQSYALASRKVENGFDLNCMKLSYNLNYQ